MNYKSQLKGWAVDRVIELVKATGTQLTLDGLKSSADELAAYAYVPREDLQSTAKDLFELVRNAPENESRIDEILASLENIKQERISEGKEAA